MTVPNFCKGCGARLEAIGDGYCKGLDCRRLARMRALAEVVPQMVTSVGGGISKDSALRIIEAEGAKTKMTPRSAALFEDVKKKIKAHPFDDVTLIVLKFEDDVRHVQAWDAPIDVEPFKEPSGSSFEANNQLVEIFKRDLTRAALAVPMRPLAIIAPRAASSWNEGRDGLALQVTGYLPGTPEEQKKAARDVAHAVNMKTPLAVMPLHEGLEYIAVPKRREDPERIAGDVRTAIDMGRSAVKKLHVNVASGTYLDEIGALFGLRRYNSGPYLPPIRRGGDDLPPPQVETDDAFRQRILYAMPLERGDQIAHHTGDPLRPSIDRVQGCFDAASGSHLDKVADLNGVKRKPGECDDNLRLRMYRLIV